MEFTFGEAGKEDIGELIHLRLKYIESDTGSLSEYEKTCIEKQLDDYFRRKLGNDLIAFVAKDGDRIVSDAYLLVVEMPANASLLNGLYGNVLSVYTEPEYRRKGLSSQLLNNLLEYGKMRGLGRIDLNSTKEGYQLYKAVGFNEKVHNYVEMRYTPR